MSDAIARAMKTINRNMNKERNIRLETKYY